MIGSVYYLDNGASIMGSVWYLDSGDSFHMTGDKELFSELEEKDLNMHIDMGDDGKCSVSGVGLLLFRGRIRLHSP